MKPEENALGSRMSLEEKVGEEKKGSASGRLAATVSRTSERMGKNVEKDEQGFTLIELLVVVIIIGILAAIAIPTFLVQQDNARDAGSISYVRNAVNAQQSYFTENGEYTRFRSDLEDHGLNLDQENYDYTEYAYSSPGASGSRVDYGPGYCVDAKHNESDQRYRATDQAQNPEEGSCDALGEPEE